MARVEALGSLSVVAAATAAGDADDSDELAIGVKGSKAIVLAIKTENQVEGRRQQRHARHARRVRESRSHS